MILSRRFVQSWLIILTIWFCVCVNAWAGNNFSAKNGRIEPPSKDLKVGEYLRYSIEWLGVPIGWITLEVKEVVNFRGHPCYHIIATAFPRKFFTRFFDADYTVQSWVDIEHFRPYRWQKHRRLRQEMTNTALDFDYKKKEAQYSDGTPVRLPALKFEGVMQDLLSSLYYIRLMDVQPTETYRFTIAYESSLWPVETKISKVQSVDIYRKGSFDLFEAKINTDLSKVILGNRKMTLYFTSDAKRLPLFFYMHTPFGPVKGTIHDIPTK